MCVLVLIGVSKFEMDLGLMNFFVFFWWKRFNFCLYDGRIFMYCCFIDSFLDVIVRNMIVRVSVLWWCW